MNERQVKINISETVWRRLNGLKSIGESFNDVVTFLLDIFTKVVEDNPLEEKKPLGSA